VIYVHTKIKGGHVHMKIKYGVTGKGRKALVIAIVEITGAGAG
jgi:hypothetical protein